MELTIKRNDAICEIAFGFGFLDIANRIFNLDRKVLVVTDDGIPNFWVKTLLSQCKEPTLVTLPAGEGNKTFATYEKLLKICIAADLTRDDCIVALGGGTIGDLAGFVAATYLRGIEFYNVPTTTLAMVDAAIGGKTGINLDGYKNQVGAFYQPSKVLVDTDLLVTLPERYFFSGYAEMLKMAVTLDADLFQEMETGFLKTSELVGRSIELKASIVAQDERDLELRHVLNFGHTIGHAIESVAGGKLLHGECVALGMIPMCSKDLQQRLSKIFSPRGLPTHYEGDPEPVIEAIVRDKKRRGDTITVVFVEEPGKYELRKLPLATFAKEIANAPIFQKGERT